MVIDHLDAVWRAALAASGDRTVAEDVTTAVLGSVAGCRVDEVADTLGIGDRAARRLLTEGLRSTLRHRRRASVPRRLPPALGCGSAVS